MQGDDLSVDIGEADSIIVNYVDRTDAAPRETFGYIATDPAYAEDNDPAGVQLAHVRFSEQKLGT